MAGPVGKPGAAGPRRSQRQYPNPGPRLRVPDVAHAVTRGPKTRGTTVAKQASERSVKVDRMPASINYGRKRRPM